MNSNNAVGLPPLSQRWQHLLMPVISLGLFVAAIWAVYHFLAEVTYDQLLIELAKLSTTQLLLAVVFTAASFVALLGYDWAALAYIGRRLPLPTVAMASFCGYAISNMVGLSLLSGGSVRYRIYLSAGLDGADVARISVFGTIAFSIGILLVGAIALTLHPELAINFLHLSDNVLRTLGLALLTAIGGIVAFSFIRRTPVRVGPWRLKLPSGSITLFQLFVSVLDIAFAGACLYVLLGATTLPFLSFLVVYALALFIGFVSNIPGGLGVFETVILLLLSNAVTVEILTAALIAYRAIYYLLPLLLALILLARREVTERLPPLVQAVHSLRSWGAKLAPPALAGLTFFGGVVLLASAATPALPQRLEILEGIVPLMVVESSTILASVIGLGLLVVAYGLYRKLNGAYVLTLAFCLIGGVVSLTKGIDYEEALLLGVTAAILFFCRREFYRKTALLNAPLTPGWIVSILGAVGGMYWVVLFSYKYVEYSNMLWWQFEYDAQASRSLRATLGVTVGVFVLALTRLLRPPHPRLALPSAGELDKAQAVIRAHDDADGNLALMGDKFFLFSERDDAFLMYGINGSTWVALGDPIGPEEAVDELAWQFRELVDHENGRIAFYQTRATTLPMYLDMGLTPLKLGEEAIVMLDRFSLDGAKRKGLRHAVNRSERDGMSFEILPRACVPACLDEITAVSEHWLAQKAAREKRFSLGAFDPAYVQRFDIALARQAGHIVAFATIFTTATKAEASVDLMRHTASAPGSTMVYLFIKLMLHFKAQGYQRFMLGIAPLAGLETHPLAPLWHRFGYLIYNRGERFYNFQGLREFKDKFDPVWEPRYLMTSGGINPLLVLTDIATLIGGGMQGVFKK